MHADRPLVCRVYPLGRHVRSDGRVEFSQLEGHPESAGVFGREGTIADYLENQQIDDFARAAERYLQLLQRLYDAWQEAPTVPGATVEMTTSSEVNAAESFPPDFLDVDKAVAAYCVEKSLPEPTDLHARMDLHLAAIEEWLQRQQTER